MELSIIIVNYQSEDYLKECLESIEKYVFNSPLENNFEVILVNNEQKILNIGKLFRFPLKIINQAENNGFGSANNRGVKKAQGKFLFFLNPDAKIDNYGLFYLIEFIKSSQAVGAVGPKIVLADENRPQPWTSGKKTTLWNILFRNTFLKPWNKNKLFPVDWLSGTALIVRKADFNKINGFDEKFFMYFEDQDLCLRLKQKNKKNFFYPFFQVVHYDGKSWNDNKKKKTSFYKSQDYFFSKHNPFWQSRLLKLIRSIIRVNIFL